MFRDGRYPDYQLSIWTRLKLWLFGAQFLGVDSSKQGDTTVEGYWLDGKFYVTKMTHHKPAA